MMTIQELKDLMKLIDRSSIQHFELEAESAKIRIAKAASGTSQLQQAAAPNHGTLPLSPGALPEPDNGHAAAHASAEPSAPEADSRLRAIVSPLVGTFYSAAEPNARPYAQIGDRIQPGSVVCIVEAMKLFNQIEAEMGGEIVEVLAQNGELVEYGQALFMVRVE
ncbi:acetyl-CoA carboxylase biotin carboxyl carrier protein [Paenibacillus doosanensis]|uniref:Biotin carboxyl carrier protein of acetyl-CoA carboxylase n=1 Tax=Paenibacillus konkukensis TaxID=2020716 RepID=A0ABY4RTI1_9BACL|nr:MULTISPECIES: acetyl-CoA carboxylase biotin carboxyl carrier protein [Paenibacillus]MCS7461187.1 acetyl-CoA carboxylase biotin carboxyl carrier protein [Paenibacillus doosanensis]UQZ85428.1 Biotin carboxyl carrier protein of acetyl-CoA carboxylase [Paenibacillus konkukensis]